MIRCCVIGNSHLAALKLGWDRAGKEHPEIAASMFGIPGKHLGNAAIESGELVLPTQKFLQFRAESDPGSGDGIRLGDYDCFVVTGADFGLSCVIEVYAQLTCHGLRNGRQQLVSRDLFRKLCLDAARKTTALHICRLIASARKAPILVVPVPLPSEPGYRDVRKKGMAAWVECADAEDGEAVNRLFAEVRASLLVPPMIYVDQAAATKASPIATWARYSENSVRLTSDLDADHPPRDYFHMNGAYGTEMWSAIAAVLKQLPRAD